jgi:ABC-type Fe3+-hydroxamate transport system substrate-binding protein
MPTADPRPTLHALFEATRPYLRPTQVKDIKTSIKYLAQALGKPDAAHCLATDYQMPVPDLKARLNTFFAAWERPPSRYTVHNTRHNISVLFQQATAAGVLPAISRPAQTQTLGQIRRESRKRNPHRSRFIQPSYL